MRGESAAGGGRVIKMINGNVRRHGCGPETRVWSNFVDFLASPGVAPLCELLRVVEGTYMEAFDLVGADRAYQHYVEIAGI